MNTEPVYCDISELVSNPVRTGIQRVAREVIRNWDGTRPLVLCRFDRERQQVVELPRTVLPLLLETDEAVKSASPAEIGARLRTMIDQAETRVVANDATVLIPEVFFDELRCRHYVWRLHHHPKKIHVLFFDFIPWLYPDIIGVERSHPLMWYVHLARSVRNAAFISDASRQDWLKRIVRDTRRGGVVLPLGADGLDLPRQQFAKDKRDFVALGSIDGRKNQIAIIKAFKTLWADGMDVSLTLVGSIFAAEQGVRTEIEECSRHPNFRHVEHATDAEVCDILSGARATIYASTTEGYGLPPVEGLYAGIPCIVSRNVPSVANLKRGVRLLDRPTPEAIAGEVRALARDKAAEKAWGETADLKLATWQDFGSATARWLGTT